MLLITAALIAPLCCCYKLLIDIGEPLHMSTVVSFIFSTLSTTFISHFLFLPSFEVVNGLLHSLLVVTYHILVHVGIVRADVLLRAAVWHRAEAQRRVLLRRLLELYEI